MRQVDYSWRIIRPAAGRPASADGAFHSEPQTRYRPPVGPGTDERHRYRHRFADRPLCEPQHAERRTSNMGQPHKPRDDDYWRPEQSLFALHQAGPDHGKSRPSAGRAPTLGCSRPRRRVGPRNVRGSCCRRHGPGTSLTDVSVRHFRTVQDPGHGYCYALRWGQAGLSAWLVLSGCAY